MFALVPGPLGIYAGHSDFSYTWQQVAQVVSNAMTTLPNIGRYLFPTATAAADLVQIAHLSSNFAQHVLILVQSNLNRTLASVMANQTEFLAFASQGNFSEQPLALPNQAHCLYYAFNTYLISSALTGNNIYGVLGRGTDPQQLATNGTKLNYKIDCQSYDEQGVCDAWWHSNTYGAFSLDNFGHMNKNYGKQLSKLLSNLTTGELLFEIALACNAEGNFCQAVNITVNAGGVNTACISQLRILTWQMDCTEPKTTSGCQFVEVPPQPDFWFQNAHSVTAQSVRSVPAGYLGPWSCSAAELLPDGVRGINPAGLGILKVIGSALVS